MLKTTNQAPDFYKTEFLDARECLRSYDFSLTCRKEGAHARNDLTQIKVSNAFLKLIVLHNCFLSVTP